MYVRTVSAERVAISGKPPVAGALRRVPGGSFGALGFLVSGNYLNSSLPLSIGFVNIPAFLIFIPITTFMARIGAKTVHSIDKNKISKFFGIFLLAVSIKFFYEYFKL